MPASQGLQDIGAIVDIGKGIFGSSTSGSGSQSGKSTTTGKTTQKLNLDQDAIMKIIADVLGGADGLVSIFAGEQSAGLYNASSSAQAAGDLASKLVGEIARLTAETETNQSQTTEFNQSNNTKAKDIRPGWLNEDRGVASVDTALECRPLKRTI